MLWNEVTTAQHTTLEPLVSCQLIKSCRQEVKKSFLLSYPPCSNGLPNANFIIKGVFYITLQGASCYWMTEFSVWTKWSVECAARRSETLSFIFLHPWSHTCIPPNLFMLPFYPKLDKTIYFIQIGINGLFFNLPIF